MDASHALRSQSFVTPILYSQLRISTSAKLARTLVARPSLCGFAKGLSFNSSGVDSALLELDWPSVVSAYIRMGPGNVDSSLAFLVKMPGLIRLDLAGTEGFGIPTSVFAAGALRHLRILSMEIAGPNPSTLALMAALPEGQGPPALTTLYLLDAYERDGPAPPALLAFLHRYGSTLLHLRIEAVPPPHLASLCPNLISLTLCPGQASAFFKSSAHPTLSLATLTFGDGSTQSEILRILQGLIRQASDRKHFPRLSTLRIAYPNLCEVIKTLEDLELWAIFGMACARLGLALQDADGVSWESIRGETSSLTFLHPHVSLLASFPLFARSEYLREDLDNGSLDEDDDE